jgi:hypothetical protein
MSGSGSGCATSSEVVAAAKRAAGARHVEEGAERVGLRRARDDRDQLVGARVVDPRAHALEGGDAGEVELAKEHSTTRAYAHPDGRRRVDVGDRREQLVTAHADERAPPRGARGCPARQRRHPGERVRVGAVAERSVEIKQHAAGPFHLLDLPEIGLPADRAPSRGRSRPRHRATGVTPPIVRLRAPRGGRAANPHRWCRRVRPVLIASGYEAP